MCFASLPCNVLVMCNEHSFCACAFHLEAGLRVKPSASKTGFEYYGLESALLLAKGELRSMRNFLAPSL